MVGSVSGRFRNARVEKMPLNIRIQTNAGTACVSERVLKTLACQGLRVGPSQVGLRLLFALLDCNPKCLLQMPETSRTPQSGQERVQKVFWPAREMVSQ